MAVTIRQIATYAGVSNPTVSHILGNRAHSYRPETRQRVLKAAKELGYRPNGSAQAMRSGRFGVVALLMSTEPNRSSLFSDLLNGLHDALVEEDLHLTIARLPDEKLTSEGYVPKILRQWTADGLLINYNSHIPGRMIELIKGHSIPSVWINTKQPSDSVYPDDLGAGRRATEHLLAHGHRRIAYVNYSYNAGDDVGEHYSGLDRQEGYAAAMRDAGLQPQIIRGKRPLTPRSERISLSREWLSGPSRPTAVVAYSDTTALPVYLTATLHLNIRIPEDLSLITFGDRLSDASGFAIDTMVIPEHETGRTAVQMLLKKIRNPRVVLKSRALPFTFAPGWSVAPALPS